MTDSQELLLREIRSILRLLTFLFALFMIGWSIIQLSDREQK